MWGRKESLKLLIPSQSLVSQGTYVCLKLLFDLSETCKREWILEYSWKKKQNPQVCLGIYAECLSLSVCVDFYFSSHQTVPVWLHCSGLPSAWPWSPSKHAGLAGRGPEATSQGCTENLAPSPPSPPRRRRWLDGIGRKYVTVHKTHSRSLSVCRESRCAGSGEHTVHLCMSLHLIKKTAIKNNVGWQAFKTLMQSYICSDVREDRIHKSLFDPVRIPRISTFHHL